MLPKTSAESAFAAPFRLLLESGSWDLLIVGSTRILHHLTLGCSPTVAGEAIAGILSALSQNAEHLAPHGLQSREPCHRVAWLDITWFSGHLTEWGAISSTPIAFTERSMTRFSYQASFS